MNNIVSALTVSEFESKQKSMGLKHMNGDDFKDLFVEAISYKLLKDRDNIIGMIRKLPEVFYNNWDEISAWLK